MSIRGQSSGGEENAKKRGRGRPKGSLNRCREDDSSTPTPGNPPEKDEDVYATVTPQKALQYSIILAELNRKFNTSNFQPC